MTDNQPDMPDEIWANDALNWHQYEGEKHCVRYIRSDLCAAVSDAPTDKERHPDDQAVDRLADAMKEKLAKKRQDGKSGWDDPFICSDDFLNECMVAHIAKGDPVDVANFCMMLFERGERTRLVSQIRGNPEDNTHSLSKLDDKAPDQSKVIKALVEALKGIEPLYDCDCPDYDEEASVGWQGDKEIPVTFGQIRAVYKALALAEKAGGA